MSTRLIGEYFISYELFGNDLTNTIKLQAYHQYGVGSRPALQITKRCTRLAAASDKVYQLLAHGQATGKLYTPYW
jgi:hypothetical protein